MVTLPSKRTLICSVFLLAGLVADCLVGVFVTVCLSLVLCLVHKLQEFRCSQLPSTGTVCTVYYHIPASHVEPGRHVK